jgi:hypothetical protein
LKKKSENRLDEGMRGKPTLSLKNIAWSLPQATATIRCLVRDNQKQNRIILLSTVPCQRIDRSWNREKIFFAVLNPKHVHPVQTPSKNEPKIVNCKHACTSNGQINDFSIRDCPKNSPWSHRSDFVLVPKSSLRTRAPRKNSA